MTILQTPTFARTVKKLPKNQKTELDEAIQTIAAEPELGELKKGELAGVRVYKFHMNKRLTLLAYTFNGTAIILTLLALGAHENFYRDLK